MWFFLEVWQPGVATDLVVRVILGFDRLAHRFEALLNDLVRRGADDGRSQGCHQAGHLHDLCLPFQFGGFAVLVGGEIHRRLHTECGTDSLRVNIDDDFLVGMVLDEGEILLQIGSNETEPGSNDRLDRRFVGPLALDEAGDDFDEFLEIDQEVVHSLGRCSQNLDAVEWFVLAHRWTSIGSGLRRVVVETHSGVDFSVGGAVVFLSVDASSSSSRSRVEE